MSELKIDAQLRSATGNQVKQLRRDGLVPVVIYGQGKQPVNAQVNSMSLDRLLQIGGAAQLVEVQMEDGGLHNVLVREVQRHPVRRNPIHADFHIVNMLVKQQVHVPVIAVGHLSSDVGGTVLIRGLSDVEIEALPSDIPAHIEVDISVLSVDMDRITVADLPVIPGVAYLNEGDEPVFSLIASRTETEAVKDEIEGEEEMEPEVIGRREDE